MYLSPQAKNFGICDFPNEHGIFEIAECDFELDCKDNEVSYRFYSQLCCLLPIFSLKHSFIAIVIIVYIVNLMCSENYCNYRKWYDDEKGAKMENLMKV